MKRLLLTVAMLALLLLAACQPVSDARSQACGTMRTAADEMGALRTAVAGSQPVQTVGQVRQTITSVRAKIDTAQQVLTAARNSDNLVQLTLALSQIEAELQGVPDATPITEVQARISASATIAAEKATALHDAVCAAK